MKKYFFILIGLLILGSGFAESPKPYGTLIVTYQTDKQRERLDRIRFWIRNHKYEQQMFPQGNAYVEDQDELTRMVVIEGLPVGDYTLEFIIPNHDGYFQKVPNREFTIKSDGVVRIEQVIKKAVS